MKTKASRLLSLFLAVLLAGSVLTLAACAKDPEKPADTTPAVTTPEETKAPETTPELPAGFDTLKFDDYDCNVLLGLTTLGRNEFVTEDTTTVLNNAIYLRARRLEEDFGVKLTTDDHYTGGYSSSSTLAREYKSGDTNYDFCISRILDLASSTVNGYLSDLTGVPNLDLTHSWWDQTVVRDSTVAGSVYFASGDISTLVNDFVCCLAFNKGMMEKETDVKPADIYKLVDEGKWTLDKLNEYSSKVSEDLNNDEVYDSRDKYGLTVWDSRVIATVHAGGDKIITLNDDGLMELTLYSDRVATGLENFINIATQQYSLNMSGMKGGVDWKTIFINEQALFTMSSFNSLEYFRNLDTDYGIIPQPKTFEDQDAYYSSIVSVHACFFAMPRILSDAERAGAIAERLAYLGKEILTPAYYEKTLVGNNTRDDESRSSVETCFATKVVDLGDYFKIGGYYDNLASLLNNKNATGFTSMYQANLEKANRTIEVYNEQIKKLKEG